MPERKHYTSNLQNKLETTQIQRNRRNQSPEYPTTSIQKSNQNLNTKPGSSRKARIHEPPQLNPHTIKQN
jgi:hypothetical protein